jgi:hypothetical protein
VAKSIPVTGFESYEPTMRKPCHHMGINPCIVLHISTLKVQLQWINKRSEVVTIDDPAPYVAEGIATVIPLGPRGLLLSNALDCEQVVKPGMKHSGNHVFSSLATGVYVL